MIKVMKVNSSLKDDKGNYLPLYPMAQLPRASHPGSSLAWDLYAAEHKYIAPGSVETIHTGIAVEVVPMSCGFLLKERSSQGKLGIQVLGGVIDADYRGEIMVMLINHSMQGYQIRDGDRIAQMICLPTLTGQEVSWYDSLSTSERGENGFGSTGV